jgi:hypothetical protein
MSGASAPLCRCDRGPIRRDRGPGRDPRLARPLSRVGRTTADGLPFFAPEVVPLYKAHEDRASDWADFATVRDALDDAQRRWLAEALRITFGKRAWIGELASAVSKG